MIIVGLRYSEPRRMGPDEINRGSAHRASMIADGKGELQPSNQDRGMAAFKGRQVAEIAKRLFG